MRLRNAATVSRGCWRRTFGSNSLIIILAVGGGSGGRERSCEMNDQGSAIEEEKFG
jgi:hypothetical protein